ncbi:hypothetical protein JXB12_01035 [candidate division KSB1 bacterium]|nr:hypothetical protein [candidate division KSB1 bacterium]
MKTKNLSNLVRKICSRHYSSNDLIEFIDLSQKIAISYLKYQEALGKNIRPKNAEGLNDLEDVAIDCIAGLFMRNDCNEFVQLNKYFLPILEKEHIDDNDMLMMLRRLIVKKTKQELSRIFRERDPEGAKIIRNIRVAIRNSVQFSSFKQMGREFVCLVRRHDHDDSLDPETKSGDSKLSALPEKILIQHFSEHYCPTDSVSVIIKKMLETAADAPFYQSCLPIDTIANLIRDVTFTQFKDENSKEIDNTSPFHDLQLKEVDAVNKYVIQLIYQKIQLQYLKKQKLDQERAEIYFKAINDFVQDLTHERECESNFRYLKRYIPNLSQKSYRDEERSIFEYLVKVTKKSLRKKLKELL